MAEHRATQRALGLLALGAIAYRDVGGRRQEELSAATAGPRLAGGGARNGSSTVWIAGTAT